MKSSFFLSLLFAALVFAQGGAEAETASDAPAAIAIKRGVNVLGYDGVWKGDVDAPFRMSDFTLIRDAGFDHVRVNFFGFRYMDQHEKLDPKVLARLDEVLDAAATAGLKVILDQHDNQMCQREPGKCKARLVAFWRQIAARYRGARPAVVYEILNEPGWLMTPEQWNDALSAALKEIRAADPARLAIVAALNIGDPRTIEKLSLPAEDRNLIVTVHYYEPMTFTHQGAPWSRKWSELHDVAWGADESRKKVEDDLSIAARWAKANDRPVYLGEFGVYDAAPPISRAAWTEHVARTAEKLGWGWGYWQFDHDFALFDQETRSWRKPVLDALIGPRPAP